MLDSSIPEVQIPCQTFYLPHLRQCTSLVSNLLLFLKRTRRMRNLRTLGFDTFFHAVLYVLACYGIT